MNNHDWVKELTEFAGAARIFKPLAGSMATRFTTSKSSSTFTGNIDKPIDDTSTLIHHPAEKPVDTAEEAAKLAMYGPLTRKVLPFEPSRLLCKRFGVRPPVVVQAQEEGPVDAERPMAPMPRRGESAGVEATTTTVENVTPVKEEVQADVNAALEEKAADEVFAAVFGSDDEDD